MCVSEYAKYSYFAVAARSRDGKAEPLADHEHDGGEGCAQHEPPEHFRLGVADLQVDHEPLHASAWEAPRIRKGGKPSKSVVLLLCIFTPFALSLLVG